MRKSVWYAAIALIAVGCGGGDKAAEQARADSAAAAAAAPPPAPPAPAAPTDADIAHIAVTANTIDIEAGEQAKAKSTNAGVKKFAGTMITDHTAVNKEASALATKLNLTPADNPTSQALKTAADSAKAAIGAKTGADFDKAYIANEVAYHQAVLTALDNTLIPNAQNAELKALLVKVRPAFEAHLKAAQDLQTKLGS